MTDDPNYLSKCQLLADTTCLYQRKVTKKYREIHHTGAG